MFHRWGFFDRVTLGDMLFDYTHPILSMCSMPIVIFCLFASLILSIIAVGKHGIIPGIALVVAIVLMQLLYSKVSNTILFVWMQPFIIFTEYIFTKYALANRNEPGVGIIAWVVFAIIALLLFYYTADFLDIIDNTWGWIYLIPYGTAWIFSVSRPIRVYYLVLYLCLFALIMSIHIGIKRKTNKNYDINEFKIWPAVVIFLVTTAGVSHGIWAEEMSTGILVNLAAKLG